MNRKFELSTIGFVIILIIVFALIMIISAPMLIDKTAQDNKTEDDDTDYYKVNNIEARLNARIEALENNQRNIGKSKYVCSIEGYLDSSGTVIPADNIVDISKKIVFVCEYR
jgi:ABC-type Na+ efflux pump permease subunit